MTEPAEPRVLRAYEAINSETNYEDSGEMAAAILRVDDRYLAAHPEHVAPEVRAAILRDLFDRFMEADQRGEFGECCANPYCRACTIGQWFDNQARAAGVVPDNPKEKP